MLRRRDPFNSIEAFIDSTDLDSDVKSALWLVAWSEQSHLGEGGHSAKSSPRLGRLRREARELGMHDRVELTRYAIRRGLVEA